MDQRIKFVIKSLGQREQLQLTSYELRHIEFPRVCLFFSSCLKNNNNNNKNTNKPIRLLKDTKRTNKIYLYNIIKILNIQFFFFFILSYRNRFLDKFPWFRLRATSRRKRIPRRNLEYDIS